jgi:hypothetical protein
MKKGLLSILAGALILVGCQNYDDQFDNLESQISALATTVAGLSQVQSDLASLAGTVSSLASTVNGLGDTIDTAVSDGLTDIQADIDAIETAVADVATSEEVTELQEAVDASEESLQELLDSSNVYSQDIIIKNVATLEFAKNLGNKLNIVNGSVALYITDDMATADVQEVASALKTITGNLSVLAKTSTIVGPTFANLTGVSDIMVSQGGTVDFSSLASAGTITLGSDFKNKVTKVDFRSLATVTKFEQAALSYANTSVFSTVITKGTATANTIDFPKSDEIHLTVLPYYTPGALTIIGEEGHTLAIDAIDDVNALGTQTDLDLTITGAASVSLPNYSNGSFSATKVATVSLAAYEGTGNTLTLSKVTNLTLGAVEVNVTISDSDLETVNITGALDTDPNLAKADKEGPAITLASATGLTSATIAGVVEDIDFTGATNLETVSVSGVFKDLTLDGNDDLTSVTVSGDSYGTVKVNNADDLETLTLGHSTIATKGTTPVTNGGLVITNNDNLLSLTVSKADKLGTLTITGNSDLATLDFDALKAANSNSATVAPSVSIGGTMTTALAVTVSANDLTAQTAQDKTETAAETAAKKDVGSFTSTSGLSDLKTYLGAAVTADGTVYAQFDSVDSVLNNAGTETASSQSNYAVVKHAKSNAVAAAGAAAAVKSIYFTNSATTKPDLSSLNGVSTVSSTAALDMTNAALWAADFITDYGTLYDAAGYTVTYAEAGAAVGSLDSATTSVVFNMSDANAQKIAYGDSVKFGVGNTTVTIPIKHNGTATQTGAITIAGVTVAFDTNSASSGTSTTVYPNRTAYSTTGSGVGYVTSTTQLEAAIVSYINQWGQSVPNYVTGVNSTSGYDKKVFGAAADGETSTALNLYLNIEGSYTKAATGAITAKHLIGGTTTGQAINIYKGRTTSGAITRVYPAGIILRFKSKNGGETFSLPTVGGGATNNTALATWGDYDGADNAIYAPAAASGNNSALYRSLDAASYNGTWQKVAIATTDTPANKAIWTGYNVDNLTDDDVFLAVAAGDVSTATNTTGRVNRTLWL